MENFKDDRMQHVESDITKIQIKPSMYISYLGKKGALHLAKEVIQNSIDECENKNSPAKIITVTLETSLDRLTVEDDGRGIPETDIPLDIVCTKLQAGSKFTREDSGKSSGENGVGITAVNAMSEHFSLSTFRSGDEHTVIYEQGNKIDDKTGKSKKVHGTITEFIPSKKYLGKETKIVKEDLEEWIDMISHFIPSKSKIIFRVMKSGKLKSENVYKSRPIHNLLTRKMSGEVAISPISLKGNMGMEETIREINDKEKKVKRDLELEFTFAYSDTIEPYFDSFCNYINTTSGGVHLDTVREGYWKFIRTMTHTTMSDKEKDKYKILKVDIENGLNLIVNLSTDIQMQLVGQTKNAVGNEDLKTPIDKLVYKLLSDYFDTHKEKLTAIIKLVKLNSKARIDASKIKAASIKESTNKFDVFKFDKFTPCNNSGKAYKELHICEGDSAAGSLIDGRDPDTQAFLAFRGVTANGFKRDSSTILDNVEWRTYVTLLKTNFGAKFDLSKCYYDKIIIETDSDIDGYGITSGIGAFHALYMPELVKAGKLYKAMAPLYHIDDKAKPFVRDKKEYVEVYQSKIIKNFKIKIPLLDNKSDMSNKDFKSFIYDTQDYSTELVRIANHYGVNKFFIERIASILSMFSETTGIDIDKIFSQQRMSTKFLSYIQEKYPEIKLVGNKTLRGAIEGKFQSININDRVVKKVMVLFPVLSKYGDTVMIKGDKKYQKVSIGEFLDMAKKYVPKIITRYKGLGEANSDQLWDTTLNPDTRILIQLTMDDVERDLRVFEKLHGTSKYNLEQRKEMMSKYVIKRDDLDN